MKAGTRVIAATLSAGLAALACTERSSWLSQVVAAVGPWRMVEPRLSGGFSHVPCRTPAGAGLVPEPRCAEPPAPGTREYSRLAKVDRALRTAVDHNPIPRNRQALAVLDLAAGARDRSLDRAVSNLERAVEESPGQADLLSDLSAAYLLLAERRDEPYDLVRSLAAADRAVAADGRSPEARFNRALALDRLFLSTAARAAWQDYLALDAGSGWADEARARLAALDRQAAEAPGAANNPGFTEFAAASSPEAIEAIVRNDPQAARAYAEIRLLAGWAERWSAGRKTEAAAALAGARRIGAALARVTGEKMVQEAVAAIDAALAARDAGRLSALAAGHRDLRDGYDLYESRKALDPAWTRLTAARAALAAGGSPLAASADFYLACCEFYRGRAQAGLDSLAHLAGQTANRPYFSLRGHIAWMTAYLHNVTGDPAAAIPSYRQAEQLFEQAGEAQNAANMRSLIGESLTTLGRYREAWREIYRALQTTAGGRNPGRLYTAFVVPTDTALQQGLTAIAGYFQEEVVRHAQESGDPMRVPDAYFWRGFIEARLGRPEASADFARARQELAGQTDETLRRTIQAGLDRVEGETAREPGRSVELLTSALDFYRRTHLPLLTLQVYLARARAYRRAGDLEQAERDLRAGLDTYDQIGGALSFEESRLAFLEETAAVFDEAIGFEIEERRRPDLAFHYADRARTRALPASAARLGAGDTPEMARLLTAEPPALRLEEIQRALPPGVALVEYTVEDDRVILWLLQRSGWRWWSRPIARRDLERAVAELRSFPDDPAGRERWSRTSAALFDLLVRPWSAVVAPGEQIILVRDKVLHALPFAALRDGARGPYLIESYPLTTAPSATLLARALAKRKPAARVDRALLVGNPAFDPGLFGDLQYLPRAEEEARDLERQLPGATLLTGAAAEKARFLSLAPQSRLIHFAGHAIVDSSNPLLSTLVLAPGPSGGSGALYAREIYALRLPATELVVLAACSTGGEYLPGSEGITSLGRAFLAAGARNVVASLWPVDDRQTLLLFQSFYRQLAAGAGPADALRAAQLSLLHDPRTPVHDPSAWGAFEVIGTGAPGATSLF